MLFKKNPGKLHIPHYKNTANLAPVRITAPKEVLLPLDQHIGALAVPVVKVGDTVKIGQLVAEAGGPVSSNIYASVSGKVTKIEDCLRANGRVVPAIRIESDGLMEKYEELTPPTVTDVDSLVEATRKAGLVGMGGAGFPTAVKFAALKNGTIHTILLNGAECEPFITSDARIMVDEPEYIYKGIKLIQSVAPSVKQCIIGIEVNKPECIKAMNEVSKDDSTVSVLALPSTYPQGAEKVLIYNAIGEIVPEGKLPADLGVIVLNVTTLATLAKYVEDGMPLVERCVTLDGSAVKKPMNVIVPIGTSVAEIVEFAGGLHEGRIKLIMGGPMTGRAGASLSEPITKTSNAVVIMNEKDATPKKMTHCIHCGKCVDACPLSLNPSAFTDAHNIKNADDKFAMLEDSRIMLCMECGCCAFACPAGRPIIESIRIEKNSYREYKAHQASLKS